MVKSNLLVVRICLFLHLTLIVSCYSAFCACGTFTLQDPSASGGQISASSGFRSDAKVPIYAFIIRATGGCNANLSNLSFSTTGSYAASDISNFKLWWSVKNSLASATQIGTYGSPAAAGVQTSTSFTSTQQSIVTFGTTSGINYFWITMDVAAGAVCNNTIKVSALAGTNMTSPDASTLTGSTTAGNTITLKPRVSSAAYTNTVNSGVAQSYAITGATSYTWTRAAVTGISNSAGSGSGTSITEVLNNTTTTSVLVTYIITPTTSSCSGTPFTYEVAVNPTNNSTCPAVPDAPTPPACGTLQELQVSSATTMTANTNYGFCGTSYTTGNVDNGGGNSTPIYVLNGQTLTISGTLNAPGNIYVMRGGTLNVSGNYDAPNGNIYVYGTMNHTGATTTLQSTATIYVASGATLSMGNTDFRFGKIINEGTISATSLKINSNSSTDAVLCLHNSGCFKSPTLSLVDNPNVITFPGAKGYFYYSGTTCPSASLNDPLTSSTDLRICASVTLATATTVANGGVSNPCNGKFGSAVVTYGCTPASADCPGAIALPVTLTFFKATLTDEGAISNWGTNSQWDSDYFIVEKSQNGIDWEYVSSVPSQNGKYSYKEFSVADPNPYSGNSYYRLVEVNIKGEKSVYAVDFIQNEKMFSGFSVYPNPSNGDFIVNINGEFPEYDFELVDVIGKRYSDFTLYSGKNEINTNLKSGIYLARLKVGPDYFTNKIIIK